MNTDAFLDKIPTASNLEIAVAEEYGTLIWSDAHCRMYRFDGVIYVTEPSKIQEQNPMLDPQDPFRHEVPDCGYGPRYQPQDDRTFCDEEIGMRDCDDAEPAADDLASEIDQLIFEALTNGCGVLHVQAIPIEDFSHLPPDFKGFDEYDVRVDTGPENQGREVDDMRVSDVEEYELSRKYIYPDGEVVIDNPWRVFIAKSGSHRVQTADGNVNYIPPGWKVLQWTPRNINDPVKF